MIYVTIYWETPLNGDDISMYTIREMNRSDIASIRKIAVVTWKNTFSVIIPEEIQAKVLNDAYSDGEMDKRLTLL
ncbi:hypothetical protein HLK66_11295 [Niallia circulans]|uniref:hypothetical protein n=2 Tax=Bacillaceae TaxID=186817 RepID=UPI0014908609|nr:hypothetical protein [Niallia circulans]QJX62175.1 hypothetical protein HLK66_11295 [Niallia circulans]